jgi:hypothetical protein
MTHIYAWCNDLPLNGNAKAARINFFEYWIFLLILLAFFVHQIIEMKDCLYQQARAKFSARKEYWSAFRSLVKFIVFDSWDDLLRFIISPPETSPISVGKIPAGLKIGLSCHVD